MSRRSQSRWKFLASGATFGAVAVIRAPAKAAEFEFKCGSDLALDQPSSVRLKQMWAAIEHESGGRVRTQFFPSAALGGMASMFSQLRVGALPFLLVGSANLAAVVPVADISSLGFAYKDADEGMRVMAGPLGDFIRQESEAKGLHVMPTFWVFGMSELGLNVHPIRTPEDVRGLRIRVPEGKIAVDLFRELGASPTPLSISEVYTALQTRLIDGEEAPLVTIETARFFEVQKYISLTNHKLSGTWLIANGGIWKSLPTNLQDLIERNARKYALIEQRDMKLVNASLADKLTRQGLAVNRVDQTPFRALLHAYYQNWANAFGPTAWGFLQTSLGRSRLN
jgi:tripartite ATP-independent transporter DctP family solute receptor